jgi:hypothetical protein
MSMFLYSAIDQLYFERVAVFGVQVAAPLIDFLATEFTERNSIAENQGIRKGQINAGNFSDGKL